MYNLIHAEIYRYKHSRLFWISILATFLSGVIYGFMTLNTEVFDDMFVVPLFVVLAAFISLTIGREYSDGTIRNKIIAGKTKTVILLSRLFINTAISMLMSFIFLLPCVIIAAAVFAKIPMSILLWTLLGFFMVNIAWAVIFTVVSSLVTSKEISAVINFILIIVIMFGAYQLEHLIGQPEFIEIEETQNVRMTAEEIKQVQEGTFDGSYAWDNDENGVITYYKIVELSTAKEPNPRYIKEPVRTVMQTVDNILPHGQINLYVSCLTYYTSDDVPHAEEYEVIKLYPIYSLGVIFILSGVGFVLFRKRNLK